MNLDNFVVRPKRRLVEKYAQAEAWAVLTEESLAELAHEVAGLPSELDAEDEEAKRFDLLMLQPAARGAARRAGASSGCSEQVKAIAGLLEEKASIPMVRQQMRADPGDPGGRVVAGRDACRCWRTARKRLRALVKLIDKQKRKPIYTDFEDQMGDETAVDLPGFAAPDSFERFRAKARAFLRGARGPRRDPQAADEPSRSPPADLDELERMLAGACQAR